MKIQDTVLLEDRTQHGLDDNRWAWVGDEGRLFVELLGEEINTKVTVLASGRRGGDANDLARTTLEDQKITHADVVAWDGDSVGWLGGCRAARRLGAWLTTYGDVNLTAPMMVMVMMEWMGNLLSNTVEAVTEGVIVSL